MNSEKCIVGEDFYMGVQRFSFAEDFEDAQQRKRAVFRFECAICREPATVSLPRNAQTSHSRRCAKHRLPRVMLGSKVEAVIIAAMGWPVPKGSVLDDMREEGSAWAVADLKLVAPILTRRNSSVTGSTLDANEDTPELHISAKEQDMLLALAEIGASDTPRIVQHTGAVESTIRVVGARLRAKRMVKKTANAWEITALGEDALSAKVKPDVVPRLVQTLEESEASGHAVIGLFD